MCIHFSISLDPEEDHLDRTVFEGLRLFLNDIDEGERKNFLNNTIKTLCFYAKNLKHHKPQLGISFSLQQINDSVDFPTGFVAS